MDYNVKKKRTQIANNQLDLFCYYKYTQTFLNVFEKNDKLGIFLSTIFVRDLSVFLFETTKMYGYGNNKVIDEIIDNKFYDDLKYVRNRIKLHAKKGNMKNIKEILEMMQLEYKTKSRDLFYFVRSDISTFYQDDKIFIGSNFYSYYVFGNITDKMKNLKILRDFSYYLSHSIEMLYETIISEEDKKTLGENFIKENNSYDLPISFIDDKIDLIIKKSSFDTVITFESFLIIQEISFIQILFFYIFDLKSINSTVCLYFIIKQIAIKFDEIFDSVFNIITHMEGGKKLKKVLLEKKILPINLATRNFAKNLRNNIHYIEYDWNVNDGLIDLEVIFKNQAKVTDWKNSYLKQFGSMMDILSNLSNVLKKNCSM